MTTKAQVTAMIAETIAVIKGLKTANAPDEKLQLAAGVRLLDLDSKYHGEFVNALNTEFGTKYTVDGLRFMGDLQRTADSAENSNLVQLNPVAAPAATTAPAVTTQQPAAVPAAVNTTVVAQTLPAPAAEPAAPASFTGNANTWLQPKYLAVAGAAVGMVANVAAGQDITVGSVVGGVVGMGAAYMAADYLYEEVDMLSNLGSLTQNITAATLGAAAGVGGARLGGFVENRFFSKDIEGAIDTPAIAAPSAEVSAANWF